VASTGGHLSQLYRLRPRLRGVSDEVVWATFDTPQSRSLLADEDVVHVRYTKSRDVLSVLRNLRSALRLLASRDIDSVVSTGSGVALSFMPIARALGKDAYYIESAARSDGPSLTGRLVSRLPGMHLYSQYPAWAEGRWHYAGSVFDEFEAGPQREVSPADVQRVVVTLGTITFRFDRLVTHVRRTIPEHATVFWQTGATPRTGLRGTAEEVTPAATLRELIRDADVVIAHAGVGSALEALQAGHCPVLIPRRHRHGEHIDDHQAQIAAELSRRGLAVSVQAEDLTLDHLCDAASRSVVRPERSAPVDLREAS
jgi:UDP-N-acetylglucosamine--N-acetylmuramyl-(pentapeptide) pyrophosphoryl-undecaprenol N-acetylglucosamine transferase